MLRLNVFFTLLIITVSCRAEWFESEGQALVIEGNKQQAKSQAIENALKKSLLIAGATVSSVKQVVNGLLTENNLQVRASGDVQSLELLSESYANNQVTVTIRADIFPRMRQCFSADYKKPVVINRAQIKKRIHANIGQIYEIDMAATEHLAALIESKAQFIDVKQILDKPTGFDRLRNIVNRNELKSLTIGLADITDTQYVLYTEIKDLSFKDSNSWNPLSNGKHRTFAISGYLYDGYTGEEVTSSHHSASAPWMFDDRDLPDVYSNDFWQSEYGQMAMTMLQNVATDIDESLMCDPTRARVLNASGTEVTLNMGRDNGVKIGDEFSLVHVVKSEYDEGKKNNFYRLSDYKVKVTSLTNQTANATSVDKVLGNIQRDDIAVRR